MRLIDAKAGKKRFNAIAQPAEYKGVIHMVVPIREIDKLPTIDAVPVVRCKDCKWRHTKACIYEFIKAVPREDNDFCSDGERRSDDA